MAYLNDSHGCVERFMEDSMIFLEPEDIGKFKMAEFDARAFQIPFIDEVENYFIWCFFHGIKIHNFFPLGQRLRSRIHNLFFKTNPVFLLWPSSFSNESNHPLQRHG